MLQRVDSKQERDLNKEKYNKRKIQMKLNGSSYLDLEVLEFDCVGVILFAWGILMRRGRKIALKVWKSCHCWRKR